jgi:hypothetical protein
MEVAKMKLNEKLLKIITEELEKLAEGDPAIAQALMSPVSLGPQNEPTRAGRSGEKMNIEYGDLAPSREDVIKAARLLKLTPSNFKDKMTIYNVATYLKNNPDAKPYELVRVVMDSRDEADYIGGDEPLQQ